MFRSARTTRVSRALGSPRPVGEPWGNLASSIPPTVPDKLQPLTGTFRGTAHLGANMGYSPNHVGAICDPADFSRVLEVAPGALGPRHGSVVVDLVEPGCEPIAWLNVVQQETFRDTVPWVVIRACS